MWIQNESTELTAFRCLISRATERERRNKTAVETLVQPHTARAWRPVHMHRIDEAHLVGGARHNQ